MVTDKPLYLITFLGGTAGNFISQLLAMVINDHCSPLFISKFNGAHDNSEIHCIMHPEYFESKIYIDHGYKWIDVEKLVSENRNILLDHVAPDWDELFEMYPNCKNIIITVDNFKLVPRITGNLYFKTICTSVPAQKENIAWLTLTENSLFKDYDSPLEVPIDILEEYFNSRIRDYDKIYHSPFNGIVPNHKQIFPIKYYDILYNPEIVLNQIRQIVGKDLPIGIETEYQRYLDAQQELVSTRMPWISDK